MDEQEIINEIGIAKVMLLKQTGGSQALEGFKVFIQTQKVSVSCADDVYSLVDEYLKSWNRTDGKTDVYYLG